MRFIIKTFIPPKLLDYLRNKRAAIRRKKFERAMKKEWVDVTGEEIKAKLKEIGIKAGDSVIVHSAMSQIGFIVGGADTIIDAFLEVLNDKGTLLMPVYPFRGTMIEHMRSDEIFNVVNSPSYMGRLTETFRNRPHCLRSLHPTHSVCALGKKAEWFVSGHENSGSPAGKDSPFDKLVQDKGKIVCFGSPLGHVTSYHVIEDKVEFPLPIYMEKKYSKKVITTDGRKITVHTKVHDLKVSKTRIDSNKKVESEIEKILLKDGILKKAQLGNGTIMSTDAYGLEKSLERMLENKMTIYGKIK